MKPYYESNGVTIYNGDCREVMPLLDPVHAIITDPPYELGFMGKAWDKTGIANDVKMWAECLRVLRPGGHLLSFGGSRTYHRMACAIEDAGFEIRDQIMWLYGSGFPKSLDVSKAIDKAAGAEREVIGVSPNWRESKRDREKNGSMEVRGENAGLLHGPPATDAARQWSGWGTALKPAHEPICVARKPIEGTVAANVLKHGTGALNIDGCRIETEKRWPTSRSYAAGKLAGTGGYDLQETSNDNLGRWPANVCHDGSDEVVSQFPDSQGQQGDVRGTEPSGITDEIYGKFNGRFPSPMRLDTGSAARFFYTAKADRAERDMNCDALQKKPLLWSSGEQSPGTFQAEGTDRSARNNHPTVKPLDLMRYLCKLLCPPTGGILLDPFMGSGSTIIAGRNFFQLCIGIELEERYCEITAKRLSQEVLGFA